MIMYMNIIIVTIGCGRDQKLKINLVWLYVVGYVIRTIYNRTESGSHPQKEEVMFLVMEFAGDAHNNSEREKWVDGINRGGLYTISDQAYKVFVIIEDLVRKHFTLSSNKIEGASTCVEAILCNND